MHPARIAIVCPDPAAVRTLTACVQGLGHSVCADESAANGQVDLALVDLEQDGRGMEAAARAGAVPVVYLVGDVTEEVLARAERTDPVCYLVKPIDELQLRLSIRAALAADARIADLRRRNAWLQFAFDKTGAGQAMIDADGRFVMINQAAVEMMRIDSTVTEDPDRWSEERSIFEPDERTPLPLSASPLVRVLAGESIDGFEAFVKAHGRDGIHVSVGARPFRDNGGGVQGALLMFRNITGEREAHARLTGAAEEATRQKQELKALANTMREQRDAVDAVFESMADAVVSVDRNGNIVTINASATRILGISTSDVGKPMPCSGLFLADRETPLPPERHPLARALRGVPVDDLRVFLRRAATQQGAHVSISSRPLRDSSGGVRGAAAVFRNFTRLYEAEQAQRRAADELQRQYDFMQMVFESISDGVVVADTHGKLTMANPSAERMVGMGLTDGPPDTWSATYGTFFPDKVTPFPSEELPLVRALQGVVSREVELFIRNPHMPQGVHVSVNGRPMRNAAGEVEGGVITLRDVTQRVLAQEELAQAFAHGRLEVVETVLHNIGNAINSVSVGMATVRERFRRNRVFDRFHALAQEIARHDDDWISWLENDPQGRTVRAFILSLADDFASQNERTLSTVERVQSRVRHIVDIIQTQESSAVGTVERKIVKLRQAIADAVKVLKESLAKRGIAVAIDCDDAPAEIWIQESRFHQMLVNLIKNAVEAIDALVERGGPDEKPRIRILARTRDDRLVLDVIDNGVGIEAEAQASIFAAGYTTKKNGSGLGLHSAANFANASGGEIRALSPGVGSGATMRVTFRLSAVRPAEEDQEKA